jgi:hypothetical protein
MASARLWHTASLLPDGNVLVAGGWTEILGSGRFMESAEVFDLAEFDAATGGPDAAGKNAGAADAGTTTDDAAAQKSAESTISDAEGEAVSAPDAEEEASESEKTVEDVAAA